MTVTVSDAVKTTDREMISMGGGGLVVSGAELGTAGC